MSRRDARPILTEAATVSVIPSLYALTINGPGTSHCATGVPFGMPVRQEHGLTADSTREEIAEKSKNWPPNQDWMRYYPLNEHSDKTPGAWTRLFPKEPSTLSVIDPHWLNPTWGNNDYPTLGDARTRFLQLMKDGIHSKTKNLENMKNKGEGEKQRLAIEDAFKELTDILKRHGNDEVDMVAVANTDESDRSETEEQILDEYASMWALNKHKESKGFLRDGRALGSIVITELPPGWLTVCKWTKSKGRFVPFYAGPQFGKWKRVYVAAPPPRVAKRVKNIEEEQTAYEAWCQVNDSGGFPNREKTLEQYRQVLQQRKDKQKKDDKEEEDKWIRDNPTKNANDYKTEKAQAAKTAKAQALAQAKEAWEKENPDKDYNTHMTEMKKAETEQKAYEAWRQVNEGGELPNSAKTIEEYREVVERLKKQQKKDDDEKFRQWKAVNPSENKNKKQYTEQLKEAKRQAEETAREAFNTENPQVDYDVYMKEVSEQKRKRVDPTSKTRDDQDGLVHYEACMATTIKNAWFVYMGYFKNEKQLNYLLGQQSLNAAQKRELKKGERYETPATLERRKQEAAMDKWLFPDGSNGEEDEEEDEADSLLGRF